MWQLFKIIFCVSCFWFILLSQIINEIAVVVVVPPGYCGLLVEGPVTFSAEATANLQHQVNLIRWPRMFLLPLSPLRVYRNAPTLQVRAKRTLSFVSSVCFARICCVILATETCRSQRLLVGSKKKQKRERNSNLFHLTCSFSGGIASLELSENPCSCKAYDSNFPHSRQRKANSESIIFRWP